MTFEVVRVVIHVYLNLEILIELGKIVEEVALENIESLAAG